MTSPTVGDRGFTFTTWGASRRPRPGAVEIVDFLKDPDKCTRLGGVVPKGRAADRRARHGQDPAGAGRGRRGECSLFPHGRPEFVEMIVAWRGRVRDLFKQARDAAPAIIFIDELDAIGPARGSGPFPGATPPQEQTLNRFCRNGRLQLTPGRDRARRHQPTGCARSGAAPAPAASIDG